MTILGLILVVILFILLIFLTIWVILLDIWDINLLWLIEEYYIHLKDKIKRYLQIRKERRKKKYNLKWHIN